MYSSSDLGNLVHGTTELLILEKIFKIIKSNYQPTHSLLDHTLKCKSFFFWLENTFTLIKKQTN